MSDTVPQDDIQKQCTQCKQFKPRTKEFFGPIKKSDTSFRSSCRECTNAKDKADRLARKPPELPPPPDGHKRCRECKQIKLATTEFFNAVPSYISEDLLNAQCKECRSAYRRGHNANEPKEIRPQSENKTCHGKCKRSLPTTLEYFSYNKSTKDRLCITCKECNKGVMEQYHQRPGGKEASQAYWKLCVESEAFQVHRRDYRLGRKEQERAYSKWYHEIHRERILDWHRRYVRTEHGRAVKSAATHRRLARKRNVPGSHTSEQIQDLLKRQRHCCYYCGKKFEKKNGRDVFHKDHTFPLNREHASNDISHIVLACPHCNMSKGDKYPWEWGGGGKLL